MTHKRHRYPIYKKACNRDGAQYKTELNVFNIQRRELAQPLEHENNVDDKLYSDFVDGNRFIFVSKKASSSLQQGQLPSR